MRVAENSIPTLGNRTALDTTQAAGSDYLLAEAIAANSTANLSRGPRGAPVSLAWQPHRRRPSALAGGKGM